MPARAAWGADAARMRSTLNTVEEPVGGSEVSEMPSPPHNATRGQGGNYYEQVEPRFARTDVVSEMPSTIAPTAVDAYPVGQAYSSGQHLQPGSTDRRPSYDDLPEGARSPAASDVSHYTSVSQRGVNPHWRPATGQTDATSRRPAPSQQHDALFQGNNDFELPSPGQSRGASSVLSPGMMPAPLAPANGRYLGGNQI